jgi:3-dehydroquinate dehydratase-1
MSDKSSKPAIVAVLASLEDFEGLSDLSGEDADFCELRIDLLLDSIPDLNSRCSSLPIPKIVTVRDPSEGGGNFLSEETRRNLYEQWLPFSTYIDVEFRNLRRFSNLIKQAESDGKGIIVSVHEFSNTPDVSELEEKMRQSEIFENRIFKVAAKVSEWSDVEKLARFLQRNQESRVAVMGMGPLGKLSRMIFAQLGSCLVYGAVGKAVIQGQWSVRRINEILSEICG